jgi:hypothetical protein
MPPPRTGPGQISPPPRRNTGSRTTTPRAPHREAGSCPGCRGRRDPESRQTPPVAGLPSPGCGEQALNTEEPVGERGDISLGRVLHHIGQQKITIKSNVLRFASPRLPFSRNNTASNTYPMTVRKTFSTTGIRSTSISRHTSNELPVVVVVVHDVANPPIDNLHASGAT